ncbi:hypothetical protein ACFYYD_01055 [Streptomyces bluensis]|uniref:hypothetical protein n=1 Tax=Streptomyces bluensis TaxID=33897 RepID=UPI00368DC001
MKDDQSLGVHERLVPSPLLCPVTFGEGRLFGLWDPASPTQGALGEWDDPDDEYRRRYRIRTSGHDGEPGSCTTVVVLPRNEVRDKLGVFEQVARKDGWPVDSPADASPLISPNTPSGY